MEKAKKFYLTKEGLEKIEKEYRVLKALSLSKSKGSLPEFWHSEDPNPEYLAFQEDMDFLETRITELEDIIKNSSLIVSPSKEAQNQVGLGATVLLEVGGQGDEFQIVGTLEANPSLGKISNESPVGRALLGHRVGDEVIVSSPVKTVYKIKKIRYQSS